MRKGGKNNLFQTVWEDCFELGEEDKRCDPVTGNVEFDGDNVDDDSTIIDGIVVDDDDDDDEVERDISSALVPDPKRYSFPRHLIVDEPVNALK